MTATTACPGWFHIEAEYLHTLIGRSIRLHTADIDGNTFAIPLILTSATLHPETGMILADGHLPGTLPTQQNAPGHSITGFTLAPGTIIEVHHDN